MDADQEEFEHIPWSSLVAETRDPRIRWLGIGVGVVVAVVLGLVVVRVIGGGDGGTVVVPGESGAGAVVESPTAEEAAPAPASISTQPVSPRLYSEAELLAGGAVAVGPVAADEADVMALIPQFETSAVAARAEWFVTDFFTVDGDAAAPDSVRGSLPAGAIAPDHDLGAGVSYVEWARAVSVEQTDADGFEVTVVFRTLAGSDRTSLRRQAVRAVAVSVAVDRGAVGVVDLPEAAALPPSVAAEAIEGETTDPVPESVRAAALAAADAWGTDATVERSALDDDWWRVEVSVTDASGLRWPLVIRVPSDA